MEFYGKNFYILLSREKTFFHIRNKFFTGCLRLFEIIQKLPVRLTRFIRHLLRGFKFLSSSPFKFRKTQINFRILYRIINWWVELALYFLDVLGFPEFYETLLDFIKFNSRPMYDWEVELAKNIFGDSINYKRVRIDELSIGGPLQKKFCYVSFYTVNSWGRMQNSILLHELTHVWQFEQMGSVYIPRALKAQYSRMGYNYGGIDVLKASKEMGKSFHSFNLEQQGDIIADYFLIKDGYQPRWGNGLRQDLPVYKSYVNEVKNKVNV